MIWLKRSDTPTATGIKEALIELAQTTGYITTVAVNNYGLCLEAHKIADNFSADAFVAFRMANERLLPNGQRINMDVPGRNYTQSAKEAAQEYSTAIFHNLPPEFDKRTWLIITNEIDHERLEYCSEFAIELISSLKDSNLKLLFFGFNSGEPEIEDIKKPMFSKLMRILQDHPKQYGLALHEYTFNGDLPMHKFWPHQIGRFRYILSEYPGVTIAITEFGWGKDDKTVPGYFSMREDLEWASDLYSKFPEIRAVALWYDCVDHPMWGKIGSKVTIMLEFLVKMHKKNAPYPWRVIEKKENTLPYAPSITRILLYPEKAKGAEIEQVLLRMVHGYEERFLYFDKPNSEKQVSLGCSMWSHQDAFNLLALAINAGQFDSRLVVLYGDGIGSGLNKEWVNKHHHELLPYIVWDNDVRVNTTQYHF